MIRFPILLNIMILDYSLEFFFIIYIYSDYIGILFVGAGWGGNIIELFSKRSALSVSRSACASGGGGEERPYFV